MKKSLYKNGLVLGIIVLFAGASVVSAINSKVETAKKFDEFGKINGDTELFYPTDDSTIRQSQPDMPQGDSLSINIRNHGGVSGEYSGLIKFDITSIPPEETIISATLNCYYRTWYDNNPAGRPFDIYKVLEDWDEATVTWNNRPSFDSQSSDTAPVPNSPGEWMDWDVTSDVIDFVSGSKVNYGWKISDDTYWGGPDIPITRLNSKEYSSERPYLEVEFLNPHFAFLFGRIKNLNTEGGLTTFDAVRLRYLQFTPFSFNTYISGEKIAVVNQILGIVTTNFAIGFFSSAALL